MIPTVDDLRSASMLHKQGDLFNPPGLTNFIGTVQSDIDITGILNLNFPPYSCGNGKMFVLYVDGVYFAAVGTRIATTWYPHAIERTARHNGLSFSSRTALVPGEPAAVVVLTVRNHKRGSRTVDLRFGVHDGIVKTAGVWSEACVPSGAGSTADPQPGLGAIVYAAAEGDAAVVQGVYPRPRSVDRRGVDVRLELLGSGEATITCCAAIGPSRNDAIELFGRTVRRGAEVVSDARAEWDAEFRAVFTPGNDRYSGHLPELDTTDEEIMRLYLTGVLGVVYFKRDNPHSVYGRAYDTLMPAYWQTVTFLWDYSLSSLVHAMLDPAVMRRYLGDWMRTDIHQHFGTEYLTGGPVGPWYSVNDYAMSRMANDYLRWSGDFAWLDETIPASGHGSDQRVLDYLRFYAMYWKKLSSAHGLADYGGINNLLECVSSYLHQVASLNAGNVFSMRSLAEILDMRAEPGGNELRREAERLLAAIQELYAEGGGYWNARYPSGELVEVRHSYDFMTVLHTIPDDLSEQQKAEMVRFFEEELKTDTWLRALSPKDPDAPFSLRPDHQWNGAYPAWPAQVAAGLYRIGEVDRAFDWLKGMARSAYQGPFGQAHFTEDFIGSESGGSPKASYEMPYICDWAVSSAGSWVNVIVESIFGIAAPVNGTISATPNFGRFDPSAELRNLPYRGELYHASRSGVRRARDIGRTASIVTRASKETGRCDGR